jgi:uncharacterized membrane protein YkoI
VTRRTLLALAVTAQLLAAVSPSASARDRDREREREEQQDRATPAIGADQAAAIVRGRYDGRVVSVQPVGRGGEGGWTVRVLLDGGRVKTVQVDERGAIRGSD